MPRAATPRGPSLVGERLTLDIGPVAHGGHCVARHEGRVVFVRHTLPGERVVAVVTEGGEGDRYLRADAIEILAAVPERTAPPCPASGPGRCGGCDWQHAALPAQRDLKAAVVTESLRRFAGLDRQVTVESLGDEQGLRWRTRLTLAVDSGGQVGQRRHRSRVVVPLADCPVAVESIATSPVWEQDWTGVESVHVSATRDGPAVVTPRPRPGPPDTVTDVVRTEAGEWRYERRADGFWQAHVAAPATYVERVLAELAPRPGERVVDLYCGAGLFTAPLADAVGPTGEVLAVEGDRGAIEDCARTVAERPWVRCFAGDVGAFMQSLQDPVDLVVLDPPRVGAGRQVIQDVCRVTPRGIAYVACDPVALARDLAVAREAGYELAGLAAYDAFPMTHHVECIATLTPTR